MNRRELKDYVLGLLSQHCDKYAPTFRDISLVTSNPERIDRYGRRLEELFREGYGVVTRDTADLSRSVVCVYWKDIRVYGLQRAL